MAARDTASLLVGLLVLFHTWGAWAAVEVNMEDRVEVYRGNTTQIACMFTSSDGVGGMIIQWFYVTRSGEKQKIYYQDATMKVVDQGTPYTDRISVNDTTGGIVLTIRDVQLDDELEFICLIKALTDGTGEGRTKLKVFAKPDRPSIEGVQTGISVNEEKPSKIGTCEVKNGFPKPNITWYRNLSPLRGAQGDILVVPSTTVESSGLFSVRSELSLKVMKEDKDDQFYCEITYYVPGGLGMIETNRINITVYYPSTAVSLWVESPKGEIKEGDSIELHCKGNGNMPSSLFAISRVGDDITWDGNMVVLDNATRLDSGVYECTTTDTDTFDMVSGNTTVFVNYLSEAYVTPVDIVMGQGEEREITCNALSSLQTQAVWLKNDVEISTGHTLTLKDATFDTAGIYVCVVTVPEIEGMKASDFVSVRVQGAPEIIEPDYTEIEESFDTTVDLTCTSRGFPTPDIIWTTSDGKIFNPEPKIGDYVSAQSVFSHTVTSDVTVTCNATNEFGTDSVTFNITAIIHTTTSATTTTTTTTTISSSTAFNTTFFPDEHQTIIINTTTSANTTATTTSSNNTVKQEPAKPPEKIKEGNGVIIAVIIICILLLAILGSVLYFLYKKGKICGRSGKQDLTKEKSSKDSIVVEMKSDNTEEAVLLGVNGEKQPPSDQ